MSRFVNGGISRLELGDGDWVDVRDRLKYGDRAAILDEMLRLRVDGGGKLDLSEGREIRTHEGNLELLVRVIVAWGGPGFCTEHDHPHAGECSSQPITKPNIEQLDGTAERILAFVEQTARGTPDFTPPPSPGSSTGAAAEASSPAAARSSSSSAAATDGPSTN